MKGWLQYIFSPLGQINEPNSLNIYRKRIKFEYVEEPLGMPWRLLNDSKQYHVHLVGDDGSKSIFELPDSAKKGSTRDPEELVNPVTMRLNQKYFSYVTTTMQKISVGVLIGILVIEVITMVILKG